MNVAWQGAFPHSWMRKMRRISPLGPEDRVFDARFEPKALMAKGLSEEQRAQEGSCWLQKARIEAR